MGCIELRARFKSLFTEDDEEPINPLIFGSKDFDK
jgi:hypothetical protein